MFCQQASTFVTLMMTVISLGVVSPRVVLSGFCQAQEIEPVDNFSGIRLFRLVNGRGLEILATNYGAIITSIKVPDREGTIGDIALGYDRLSDYINAIDRPYFGAIVGRYGNRIAGGKFSLDGTDYQLPINNEPNSLHGGYYGFDKVVWDVIPPDPADNGSSITFRYLAKDGEEGYPGNLDVTVRYRLTDDNELIVDYLASTDKPTVANLTQHTYFNLKGEGNGDILGHQLRIHADRYTPVNETLIPTGELAAVAGTPFDFCEMKEIGQDIDVDHPQLRFGGGYDHNWVLNRGADQLGSGSLVLAAEVYEPTTGRVLTVRTTEPGMQFYCGNFLDGRLVGKSGRPYVRRGGFCLETQHFPDSPNQANFPSTAVRPGAEYRSQTIFRFSVRD